MAWQVDRDGHCFNIKYIDIQTQEKWQIKEQQYGLAIAKELVYHAQCIY